MPPGVNADGHREILGVDATSAEDGAGWLGFLRGLVARGLSGVALVTSDAHAGLVAAIGRHAAPRGLATLANRLVGILHGCPTHRTSYNETTAWPTQETIAA
ncbi:hypothetical protein F4554_003697 [Actinopolymorpha rutila]|uniref:Mutator family transposase n=1 Tax=Actinopolymorpha rutila TaxID=446787 RepID=A0A852ZNL1_9ACTN|nr:hypothetical protein [Actinopolymorpha rutila]